MKSTLSRRDFLKYCGVGTASLTAAVALAGCGDGSNPGNTQAPAPDPTEHVSQLEAGQGQGNAAEVDTARETTATSGKRYPFISWPLSRDPQDMDVRNWWQKGDVSAALYEGLGEDNKTTNFPDFVMVKSYTQSDPLYITYAYEKNDSGENTNWVEGVQEAKKGDEGAVEAVYWDIELYDYITDSEGRNITADDVVYCYKEELNSGFALKYNAFIWVEATGKYTLRMYFNKANYDSLGSLEFIFGKTAIYSKAGAEAGNYIANPITTSAYKLVSYTSGSEVVLEARDDYWQTDKSKILPERASNVQTIRMPIIMEPAQVVIALQTDVANYSDMVNNDDLPDFAEGGAYADKFHIFRAATAETEGILFNCYEGHAGADIKFRQGCCYALNTEAIAQGAGTGYFPCIGPGSSGASDYDTALDEEENPQTVFDVAKAKQLIDESSYNGEKLIYLYANNEAHEGYAAQVVLVLLQNVGVNIELTPVDGNAGNAMQPDPSKWDMLAFSTRGSAIVAGINRQLGRTDFDTAQFIGYQDALGFQNDDEMYRLFKYANASATFGKEATGALLRHIVDNSYIKFVYGKYNNFVYTSDIAELAFQWNNQPVPWGCTFYVDDQINDISK